MIPKEKIEQQQHKNNPGVAGEYITYRHGFFSGVRFAEAELQTFKIDFAGHVEAKVEFKDGKLYIIAATDGYGDAIDPDQITITPIEQ